MRVVALVGLAGPAARNFATPAMSRARRGGRGVHATRRANREPRDELQRQRAAAQSAPTVRTGQKGRARAISRGRGPR